MKKVLSPEVEAGRVHKYADLIGKPVGNFTLVHPETGRRLNVLVSDGTPDPGMPVDDPATKWEHVSVTVLATFGVCPTWAEMCWIKDQFWDEEEWVLQYHPAKDANISFHPSCLHLWRPKEETIPVPPSVCVHDPEDPRVEKLNKALSKPTPKLVVEG